MKNPKTVITIVVILAIWFALTSGISFYIDSLWFRSVGYPEVFNKTLWSKFTFWLAGFGSALAVLGLNFWLASRRSFGTYWIREDLIEVARKGSDALFWIIIFVVSAFVGLVVQSRWFDFLQFQNQLSSGVNDPIFQKDLSFYFFSLPIWNFLMHLGLTLIFLSFAISAVSYVIHGHLGYFRRLQLTPSARIHLLVLMGMGLFIFALRFWLLRFDLLYSRRGFIFGAGYTDLNAQLYAYWILAAISALTALFFLASIVTRTLTPVAVSAVLFVVAYLLVNGAYPALVQTFIVKPNELEMEAPYIQHNIRFTSQAYGLEKIETREFAATANLTLEQLLQHESTIRNIRLWDWRPMKQCYNQLQSIRPYYEFEDIDVDRYFIQGNYRQVMLAVRELDFAQVPPEAQNWINQNFLYTNGYGLALSPVNEVTPEGLPEFFIKDIPPRSSIDLQVKRPEIYFGEKTTHPVFVRTALQKTSMGESTNGEAAAAYEADRGIPINSFWMKLLLAWELGSYEVLATPNFTEQSRVLLHRKIQDRIRKIAPFLLYDTDPYVVVENGRLFWIQDAYTVTDRYPYSQPSALGFNYMRNSVKVTVDVYLGDLMFYVADLDDPLVRVYDRIFPNLFKPLAQMPQGLRQHVRYPEGFFNVQREMYRTYHMRDPRAVYNKEDLWEIPTEIYAGNQQLMESYYTIMSLPGSDREEFILLTPFTPRNKNNMIAWLAARSDGEHYGKLVLYQFPRQKLTYGPMQIEARIDQDPNISQLITLWSQKGSQVIRGNLLVIPIEESILYVEPLYLQAEKGQIPELTRIIVVYENRVAMGETLERALAAVFSDAPGRPPTGISPAEISEKVPAPAPGAPVTAGGTEELVARALQHYQRSQEFLRQGNWSAYGEEQRKLGEALEQLSRSRR